MKAPQWRQHVLLVSDDPEMKASIFPAFGPESQFFTAPNKDEAMAKVDQRPVQVLIIDVKTTDPSQTYYDQIFDDKEPLAFIELSQYASQVNQGLTIILLVNKLRAKDGEIARRCGAVLIMDRKALLLNRMIYLIEILRKRTFRTILTRDLPEGAVFPVDIYSHLSLANRYVHFLPAGDPFSQEKKEKLQSTHTRHLYVQEKDLHAFLQALRERGVGETYSEALASIRHQYRQMIVKFFDLSTDGMLVYGKELFQSGMDLIAQLENLIDSFPTTKEALSELPYPRFSSIAHGLNCAMYALIFARHCRFENAHEIALSALIHNLGFSEIDQRLIRQNEADLSEDELKEYQKHVFYTMETLRKKLYPTTPLMEQIFLLHHENYDGSGFPQRLKGPSIPKEVALISIIGSFDYFNTVNPNTKPLSPFEAWQKLRQFHNERSALAQKFNPALLLDIDQFFLHHFNKK